MGAFFMYSFLSELERIILDRRNNPSSGAYTSSLFEEGLDRILKKIGEEAGEVIIAAKNDDDDAFKHEVADLVFHLLVLMRSRDIDFQKIVDVLEARHG